MKRKIACRAASRLDITVDREGGNPISEDIQDGCLMRIADALERLATGKTELETLKELESQKRIVSDLSNAYNTRGHEAEHLWRRVSALKGVITKLKKKLKGQVRVKP